MTKDISTILKRKRMHLGYSHEAIADMVELNLSEVKRCEKIPKHISSNIFNNIYQKYVIDFFNPQKNYFKDFFYFFR